MSTISFTYLLQPPKRYTFEQLRLKKWVEKWCVGTVLNLFAGKVYLNVDKEARVDIDPQMPADVHMDAYKFVTAWKDRNGKKFGTIVLDPPYGLRKAKEKYGGRYVGSMAKIMDVLPEILVPGGHVISLGRNSVGMSRSRGFEKLAICLVCHSGDHGDTICVVERKIVRWNEQCEIGVFLNK